MANQRTPNDSSRSGRSDDRFGPSNPAHEDQIDPALQEGPVSSNKVWLLAIAVAVIVGAVFYGLNNTSVHEAQTEPPAQTAQSQTTAQPPATAPKANNAPGTTTGSATAHSTPPQSSPQGSEVDRAKK